MGIDTRGMVLACSEPPGPRVIVVVILLISPREKGAAAIARQLPRALPPRAPSGAATYRGPRIFHSFVIPAKAGTHLLSLRQELRRGMGPRLRGDDEEIANGEERE